MAEREVVTYDKLSGPMRDHLAELAVIADRRGHNEAFWQPGSSGEWAIARALARRRLLDHNPHQGQQAYALTDLWYETTCDRCNKGVHVMPSASESRQCAAEDGWVRKRVTGRTLDLCDRCKNDVFSVREGVR